MFTILLSIAGCWVASLVILAFSLMRAAARGDAWLEQQALVIQDFQPEITTVPDEDHRMVADKALSYA